MRARGFAYGALVIGVAAEDDGHLAWLEEFLCPPFGAGDGTAPDVTVVLAVDPARHRTETEGWSAREEIECFALDSAVLSLPVRHEADGAFVVRDEQFGTFYRIDRAARRVEVLAPRDRPALRTPLMRIVREIAMNHARRRGELFVHAASIAIDGRAALLCGVKNAGKTTLLVHAMTTLGAGFLGNDRAVVTFDDATPRVRGMPSIVTVRPPTLALLPEFRDRLEASGYHSRATLAELADGTAPPPVPFSDGRTGLTPLQLARLAGTESIAAATAHAIAFPRVTGRPGPLRVRPLDTAVAAERLAGSAWDGSNLNHVATGLDFEHDAPRTVPSWQDRCARLVARVRAYEVELGTDAYADAAASRAELGRIFA
jgi:hypothetical protein